MASEHWTESRRWKLTRAENENMRMSLTTVVYVQNMERTLLVWVGHQSVSHIVDMKSIIYFSTDYIYFMQMLHGQYNATDDISTSTS